MNKHNNRYSAEEIWYMDAGKWTLGNDELRRLLSVSLSKIPSTIVDKVYQNCLFHSLEEDAKGDILSPKLIKDAYLINIHSKVLHGYQDVAIDVILHEVAHFYLGQRHLLVEFDLCPIEYDKQEKEANQLVEQWLQQ